MVIKPIPKHLLIHDVSYFEYLGGDEWAGETYADEVVLNNVRFAYGSMFSQSSNADNLTYKAELFYDVTNSKPADMIFVEESKIVFDGKTFFVKEVEPFYTTKHHHTVVRLV